MTLRDRLANHAPDEAHRLTTCASMLRLSNPAVAKKTAEVFADEFGAATRLTETGIWGLGGKCPLELAETAGREKAGLCVLTKIEYGIPP